MLRVSLCSGLLFHWVILAAAAASVKTDVSKSEDGKTVLLRQDSVTAGTHWFGPWRRSMGTSVPTPPPQAVEEAIPEAEIRKISHLANRKELLEAPSSIPVPQRRLASSQSDGRVPHEDGVECSLTGRQSSSYFDKDSRTWRVTVNALDEIEGDLQAINYCSRVNDVVLIDVSSSVQPASRVCISWNLQFGTQLVILKLRGTLSEKTVHASRNTTLGQSSDSYLPTIMIDVSNVFGQNPAIRVNEDTVVASMASLHGFFAVSLSVRLTEGSEIFSDSDAGQKFGIYEREIDFGESALQKLGITLEVKKRKIGEMLMAGGPFCRSCSGESHNIFRGDTAGCIPCPENGNCTKSFIQPRDGYWIQSPCLNKPQRCLIDSACKFEGRSELIGTMINGLESRNFDETFLEHYMDAQCGDGYTGPLCGSCEPGHGRSQSSACGECFAGFANVTVVVLSILILLFISGITVRSSCTSLERADTDVHSSSRGIVGFSRSISSLRHERMINLVETGEEDAVQETSSSPALNLDEDKQLSEQAELSKWKTAELFKITINNLQLTAVAISIDVKWQCPLKAMFKAADFLSGVTAEVTSRSVDCLVSEEYPVPRSVLRVVIHLLVPVVAVFLYFVFWSAIQVSKGESFAYLIKKFLLSAIAVLYVSYISLTRILANILNCVDVYDSEQAAHHRSSRWIADTTVHCYQESHALLAGAVGCPFLLLFSVGFPLTLACMFIFQVKENIKSGWIYETAGFMFRAYSPSLVFWESIIMLRKAFMVMIVVFAYPLGGNLQGILGIFVLILALYAQLTFRPYRSEFDILNSIEGLSLLVSLVTFVSSLFFRADNVPIGVRTPITAAVLVCNFVLFAFFIRLLFVLFVDHLKWKLQAERVEHSLENGVARLIWIYCRHEFLTTFRSLKRTFSSLRETNVAEQADE